MSLLPWKSDFWQTTLWIAKSTISKVCGLGTRQQSKPRPVPKVDSFNKKSLLIKWPILPPDNNLFFKISGFFNCPVFEWSVLATLDQCSTGLVGNSNGHCIYLLVVGSTHIHGWSSSSHRRRSHRCWSGSSPQPQCSVTTTIFFTQFYHISKLWIIWHATIDFLSFKLYVIGFTTWNMKVNPNKIPKENHCGIWSGVP